MVGYDPIKCERSVDIHVAVPEPSTSLGVLERRTVGVVHHMGQAPVRLEERWKTSGAQASMWRAGTSAAHRAHVRYWNLGVVYTVYGTCGPSGNSVWERDRVGASRCSRLVGSRESPRGDLEAWDRRDGGAVP